MKGKCQILKYCQFHNRNISSATHMAQQKQKKRKKKQKMGKEKKKAKPFRTQYETIKITLHKIYVPSNFLFFFSFSRIERYGLTMCSSKLRWRRNMNSTATETKIVHRIFLSERIRFANRHGFNVMLSLARKPRPTIFLNRLFSLDFIEISDHHSIYSNFFSYFKRSDVQIMQSFEWNI